MGRPADRKTRKYTDIDKKYLEKTAKERADRNRDAAALKKKGVKLSPKPKGSTKGKKIMQAGHTPDKSKGGTDSSPVKKQSATTNLGWRKGIKGDGGRAATRKRTKKG